MQMLAALLQLVLLVAVALPPRILASEPQDKGHTIWRRDVNLQVVSCVPTWNMSTYSYDVNLTWSVSPGNDYDDIVRFEVKFYSDYYFPKYPYKSVASIAKQDGVYIYSAIDQDRGPFTSNYVTRYRVYIVWAVSGNADVNYPLSLAPPTVSPALTQDAFQELSVASYDLELKNGTAVFNNILLQWRLEGSFPVVLKDLMFNVSIGKAQNEVAHNMYKIGNVNIANSTFIGSVNNTTAILNDENNTKFVIQINFYYQLTVNDNYAMYTSNWSYPIVLDVLSRSPSMSATPSATDLPPSATDFPYCKSSAADAQVFTTHFGVYTTIFTPTVSCVCTKL